MLHVSRRKRKGSQKPSHKHDTGEPVALYECLGCGRKWAENLAELTRMRLTGQSGPHHSGTSCPCGHPYIKWLNYDELAPRLNQPAR